MHHSLDAKVLHVGKSPGYLVQNIQARLRAANHAIAVRVLERRVLLECERKGSAADEFLVANRSVAVLGPDEAGFDGQILFVDIQSPGRLAQQSAACRSGCQPDLHPAVLDRQAAVGGTLIRREQGVALNDVYACHGDVEFFGGNLSDSRTDPRAEINFTREDGDVALPVDRKKSIDPIRCNRLGHGCRRSLAMIARRRQR